MVIVKVLFLLNKFTPIVANDIKHVSQIMYPFGISYFAQFLFKLFQYFIVRMSLIDTITNNSTGFNKSKINFSIKVGFPFHPHNFPHMDVVIFDSVFILSYNRENFITPQQ